jgi:hypothetical protein
VIAGIILHKKPRLRRGFLHDGADPLEGLLAVGKIRTLERLTALPIVQPPDSSRKLWPH